MKYKILRISPGLIFDLLSSGSHPKESYSVTGDPVPNDAKLINAKLPVHGWPSTIELLLESSSFEDVPEGDKIPFLEPIVEKS
jgi:hypothetical protein